MALRDKIKHLIEEQGRDVFKKSSISGIMDDYGCFKDELPALKNIFRTLAQNGYIAKFIDIDNNTSWKFEVQNAVHSISETYGFSESLISDILKEYALGIGIINSDNDWICLLNASSGCNYIPNNEIWYTSYDENIIKPNTKNLTGNHIVNNTYENGKGVITFTHSLTNIWSSAFNQSIDLKSIHLPPNVLIIKAYAFQHCWNLINVNMPENTKEIGKYAFEGCLKLPEIKLPENLVYINQGAFGSCEALSEIIVPDNVIRIGEWAFSENHNLYAITLPKSIKVIGNNAFYNCNNLKSIYCKANMPPRFCCVGLNTGTKIYVPTKSIDNYKSDNFFMVYNDIYGYNFENE